MSKYPSTDHGSDLSLPGILPYFNEYTQNAGLSGPCFELAYCYNHSTCHAASVKPYTPPAGSCVQEVGTVLLRNLTATMESLEQDGGAAVSGLPTITNLALAAYKEQPWNDNCHRKTHLLQ